MKKLKQAYATDVFLCESGYFTLVQEDAMNDERSVVMLSPSQMDAVSQYWNAIKSEANETWEQCVNIGENNG